MFCFSFNKVRQKFSTLLEEIGTPPRPPLPSCDLSVALFVSHFLCKWRFLAPPLIFYTQNIFKQERGKYFFQKKGRFFQETKLQSPREWHISDKRTIRRTRQFIESLHFFKKSVCPKFRNQRYIERMTNEHKEYLFMSWWSQRRFACI